MLQGRLNALIAEHSSQGGEWQRHVFWGDEGLPAAFWEHLTLQGLFATPKLLIIRNAQNLPVETLRQLSPHLEQSAKASTASIVWPVLCFEVAFERDKTKIPSHVQRLPFYILAERQKWTDITPPLTPQSFPAYLKGEAARLQLALSPAQVGLLARTLPLDAAQATSDLAKLVLMTDASGRLPDHAIAEVAHTPELGIFELMRSLQQGGNTPAVWRQILEDRLGGENSVFAVIAILLREGRVLWQTLAGTPPPLPPQVLTSKKFLAQSLGFAGLAKIWELALQADKGIKTGERSPEQAFEMLAADLFSLFKV